MRGMVDSCLILLWRNQIINTYVAIPKKASSQRQWVMYSYYFRIE